LGSHHGRRRPAEREGKVHHAACPGWAANIYTHAGPRRGGIPVTWVRRPFVPVDSGPRGWQQLWGWHGIRPRRQCRYSRSNIPARFPWCHIQLLVAVCANGFVVSSEQRNKVSGPCRRFGHVPSAGLVRGLAHPEPDANESRQYHRWNQAPFKAFLSSPDDSVAS